MPEKEPKCMEGTVEGADPYELCFNDLPLDNEGDVQTVLDDWGKKTVRLDKVVVIHGKDPKYKEKVKEEGKVTEVTIRFDKQMGQMVANTNWEWDILLSDTNCEAKSDSEDSFD